jgi:hypothetical protein
MPALSELAAVIDSGVVVNVAALASEVDYSAWLDAMAAAHDEVRVVAEAGIGWTVEVEGLRPPSPYPSWVWDGSEWVAPVPMPEGPHSWDEDAGAWVPVV